MLFLIWADEKYNTHKNPSVVFATQKNPGVFHRPPKIPFGQNVRDKFWSWDFFGYKIWTSVGPPASLKYVSGAPGCTALQVSYEPEPNELPKERLRGRQEFGGLIFGGAYFWNFTVCLCLVRPCCLSMIFLIAGDFFSNSTDWRSCRISSQPFYPLCIQLNHH